MFNNTYYYDEHRGMLWILPAKNASSSIKRALELGEYISRDEAVKFNVHFTVGVIRHPLERLVSALYSARMGLCPFRERLLKWLHDSHVRPQAPAFIGLRVDYWLHVERLSEEWPMLAQRRGLDALPHLNIGSRRNGRPADWRDACDWSEFMPIYEEDFQLCSDWQRP